MSQELQPGDFLVYQLESAVALLRVLDITEVDGQKVWHIAAFDDFFPDVEAAQKAITSKQQLSPNTRHVALTDRAFESTQTARVANAPITEDENALVNKWKGDDRKVYDRSIRLLLGLR
mgnify:CR=1 FL=1